MSKKKVVLNFQPHLIDQPIIYRLVAEKGLTVNILRARITPKEWGNMVVELRGDKASVEAGLNFLMELGLRRSCWRKRLGGGKTAASIRPPP